MSEALVCTGTIVLNSGAGNNPSNWRCQNDLGNNQPFSIEPINTFPPLSITDAEAILASALIVWAIAWGARQLINLLHAKPR